MTLWKTLFELFVQLKAHFLFSSCCYDNGCSNNNNSRNNDDDEDDDATMTCSKSFFSSVGLIDHLSCRQQRKNSIQAAAAKDSIPVETFQTKSRQLSKNFESEKMSSRFFYLSNFFSSEVNYCVWKKIQLLIGRKDSMSLCNCKF